VNVSQWLKHARLELIEFESAALDAELLLCEVLKCNRTHLYAWPDKSLPEQQLQTLNRLLLRRVQGEPVAYLVGYREFWSLELGVCSDVLVPRPDTELIVELALAALKSTAGGAVLDAGTGSGAIAIALAYEWQQRSANSSATSFSELNIVASDLKIKALHQARQNANKHELNNITFVRSNWLQTFDNDSFAMIISNPPYLAENDPHLTNKSLQHEPIDALVSGRDGLDDIRELIKDAPRVGKPDCMLLIEHGATQAAAVRALMGSARYSCVRTHQDIAGLDRVSCGICPKY